MLVLISSHARDHSFPEWLDLLGWRCMASMRPVHTCPHVSTTGLRGYSMHPCTHAPLRPCIASAPMRPHAPAPVHPYAYASPMHSHAWPMHHPCAPCSTCNPGCVTVGAVQGWPMSWGLARHCWGSWAAQAMQATIDKYGPSYTLLGELGCAIGNAGNYELLRPSNK